MQDWLVEWHRVIEAKDKAALAGLLSETVVFRSPVVFAPYAGKQAALLLLGNVIEVFENFRYTRQWVEERSAVLEFEAEVEGKKLSGVDLIELDGEGRIARFDVLVRPMSGLQALQRAMGQRLQKARL
jgi:hypothetical protein